MIDDLFTCEHKCSRSQLRTSATFFLWTASSDWKEQGLLVRIIYMHKNLVMHEAECRASVEKS